MTRKLWTMVAILAAACGDDGGSARPDAAEGPPDAAIADAATPDAEDRGDDNDSFGEAVPVGVNDPAGVGEAIAAPNDKDYYTFTTTAPGWFIMAIEANPMDDPDMLDAVITLFDANMTQLAQNDDAVPRINTDSEIITYLPAAGQYYIEVQEFGDWTSGIPEFGDDYLYTLRVAELSMLGAANIEPATDPGNTVADAVAAMTPGVLAGFFNDAADVDVYSVTVAAGQFLEVSAMPDGTDGYGSTSDIGNLWVTDVTGTTIMARVNAVDGPFDGPFQVSPTFGATGGTALVWIERSGATPPGANDFWVAKAFTGMDNPREAEPPAGLTNDSIATAEPVMMTDFMMFQQGFLLTELSTDVDVDYWSVPIAAGQAVNVFCSSRLNGSGVEGLNLSVRRADDSVVATQTENPNLGLQIQNANPGAAGTVYLRFAKTAQDPEVTGTFVRCGLATFTP